MGADLALFRSYLINGKQHIHINNDNEMNEQKVICEAPQGSILQPSFLIHTNNLNVSKIRKSVF